MRDKVVLSLSTIPPRFEAMGASLNALLNQRKKADEIHVYVPKHYRRFPEHEFKKPDVPEGVSVKIVDEDYGPATKVLPCAKSLQGTQARIVYCDDDRIADPTWLECLIKASNEHPNDVIVSSGMTLQNYDLGNVDTPFLPRAEKQKVKYDLEYLSARLRQKTM